MENQVPAYVRELWDKGAFHKTTTLVSTVPVATGTKVGAQKFENLGFGNRTVIGMALNVADGTAKVGASKTSTNDDILTFAQCQLMHISFIDALGTQIVDKLPLTALQPPAGDLYVPIYLENFNPGKSFFEWCATLGNTTNPVSMELVLYCL